MNELYKVVLVHQGGQLIHRNGTIDLTDGEPVRVHDFDDLNKAKEFCTRIVSEAPAFKCQIYRDEEKISEHANTSWIAYEQRRLRIAQTFVKRWVILATICSVGWGVVGLLALAPGGSHYVGPASVGVVGLMILAWAGPLAFSSVPALAPAADSIGARDLRIARAACVLGILVGLFLLAFAVSDIVTHGGTTR